MALRMPVIVTCAFATAFLRAAPQQGPFHLSCSTLPFETIKKDRDIDDLCDRAGTASTEPLRAQNRAKNQFCAAGPSALATVFSFEQLQKKAEDAGITDVPADRSALEDLHTTTEGDTVGEGSVVHIVGFLIKGKFSNVGSGETVNCSLPDREENDIHLNIVKDKPPVEPTTTQL